jgi:L-aspartate oxidase
MSAVSTMPPARTDMLVIGSGIAGLSFALEAAAGADVLLVTKSELENTNTNRAQGGIASVLKGDDSYEQHIADTLDAGAGLCHEEAVRAIVENGPESIAWLVDHGTRFTRTLDGQLHLGREGGHQHHRIVHADDLTGAEIERALLTAARAHPRITLLEHWIAVDLITPHHFHDGSEDLLGPCYGAYLMPVQDPAEEYTIHRVLASATVLATGGSGRIYQHTTNPEVATGDGVALAYRAGATLANLEFFQFHPTSLAIPGTENWLISEAMRGHGALLVDKQGRRIMQGVDDRLELAPRDIVARGIDRWMKRQGEACVYLDARHLDAEDLRQSFPNIHRYCLSHGLDVTRDQIPVVPAAHYQCGGVLTDLYGRSSLPNLFAVGEVACTGVHGANRLASNSLLEAVVFARSAARLCLEEIARVEIPAERINHWDSSGTFNPEEWVLVQHDLEEIRRLMWDFVGIVRKRSRLERARARMLLINREIETYYKRTRLRPALIELRNVAAVAYLTIKCALGREESRGLHFRSDFPQTDDLNWKRDTLLSTFRPSED